MEKTLIVVQSDPKAGTEEALGRVFNALAMTWDLQQRGRDVALVFQGAGTRWVAELKKEDHPAHALFVQVRKAVQGASGSCAALFGATADVEEARLPLLRDARIPGTDGMTSLASYVEQGYRLVSF